MSSVAKKAATRARSVGSSAAGRPCSTANGIQTGLPRPKKVQWSDHQQQRWGSCTPEDGAIRVSSRLAAYPSWVLDYVLVHELAHLVVANHGPAHDRLVDQFPHAERARGFLIAIDLDPDEGDDVSPLSPADVRP